MKKGRLFITAFSICFLCILCFTSCPADPSDNNDPVEDDDDNPEYFIWSKAPDGKTEYLVAAMETDVSSGFTDKAVINESDNTIEPDRLQAAYRYIALVPEDCIRSVFNSGIYGHKSEGHLSAWDPGDLEEYLNGTFTKNPGVGNTEGEPGCFSYEAFLDNTTPTTRSTVMNYEDIFVFFDGRNGTEGDVTDDSVMVFDLDDPTIKLEVEDTPPPGVRYTGIAYELVYYEAYIEDYGSIRLYFNDIETEYKTGDMLVNRIPLEDDVWEWVYLKHGDGPDTLTSADTGPSGGYNDVWVPVDPLDPYGDHEYQPYDGYYDLEYSGGTVTDVPVFMFDNGDCGWCSNSNAPNYSKRPAGSAAGIYWTAVTQIMCGNEFLNNPYTAAAIHEDENPGGFYQYTKNTDGYLETAAPISFGTPDPAATIKGNYELGGGTSGDDAGLVYYETDDHLGTGDMSRIIYLSSRLSDGIVCPREEMRDNYGVYAYDSALVSNVYDDSRIFGFDPYNDDACPTLLDLFKGRMCVTGSQTVDTQTGDYIAYWYPEPQTGPDSLLQSTVRVEFTLELEMMLSYGEDCEGRSWDSGTIASTDFQGRFMEFTPNTSGTGYFGWGTDPDGPVPCQRGFYGAGSDDHALETDLNFNMGRFHIDSTNIPYCDVYSLTPELLPSPDEGPFPLSDSDLHVSVQSDSPGEVHYYYTLDGTDPDETSAEYSSAIYIGNTDTHIKIIAYETEKEFPSAITDAWYLFADSEEYTVHISLTGFFEAGAKPLFCGLFTEESIDISSSLSPVYSTMGETSEGSAFCSIDNVQNGDYYAALIIDMDSSGSFTPGDLVYADPAGVTGTDISLGTAETIDTNDITLNFSGEESSWYEVP